MKVELISSYSVWDRVVGGSCAVMMCVGVAIILSVKRKVLGLTSNHDLTIVLQTVSSTYLILTQVYPPPPYTHIHRFPERTSLP